MAIDNDAAPASGDVSFKDVLAQHDAAGRSMTIGEFIKGSELEDAIGKRVSTYRKAFLKIVKKAGVADSDIHDKAAHKKIRKTAAWSGAGFLFQFLWAVYRKMTLGWIVVGAIVAFDVCAMMGPQLRVPMGLISLFVLFSWLMFMVRGKSLFLVSVLKAQDDLSDVKEQSSFGMLIAALVLIVGLPMLLS
jgi:hypothetical protein